MTDVKTYLAPAEEKMEMAVAYLDETLARIRAGKANAKILDGLRVEYYGSLAPVSNVANISVPDARTITITPWEKSMFKEISPVNMSPFAECVSPVFTSQDTSSAIYTLIPIEEKLLPLMQRFRIMTPPATKRASLQKDRRADSRSVLYAEMLNIKQLQQPFNSISNRSIISFCTSRNISVK